MHDFSPGKLGATSLERKKNYEQIANNLGEERDWIPRAAEADDPGAGVPSASPGGGA